MSLYDSFVSWYSGTPTQAEQDAGQAAANQRYAATVQEQVDLGNLDPQAGANLIAAQDAVKADNQAAGFTQGAVEGLQQGIHNIISAPGKAASAVGKDFFGSIPWWVYGLAGVALFLWMGGATLLKGWFARA